VNVTLLLVLQQSGVSIVGQFGFCCHIVRPLLPSNTTWIQSHQRLYAVKAGVIGSGWSETLF